MSKNSTPNDEPQRADALEKINKIIGNSTNKLLYILVADDPSVKQKFRLFVTSKVDKMAAFADIIGYEVTSTQSSKLKNWDDAVELAEKGKLEIISISFPWHRVISIKNVSYKTKSA